MPPLFICRAVSPAAPHPVAEQAVHHVIQGFPQALSQLSGHVDVPGIERLALLNRMDVPGHSFHVAVHVVSQAERTGQAAHYMTVHSHPTAELNILLSERSSLTYRYEVDGATFDVTSPATVFIDAGTPHRMEVLSGEGLFLCIQLDAEAPPR